MDINLQAKFLKACGTIVETPAEIRKASRKLLSSPHDDRDLEPPKYPSLSNAALETHPDLLRTPAKHLEEGEMSRVLLNVHLAGCNIYVRPTHIS